MIQKGRELAPQKTFSDRRKLWLLQLGRGGVLVLSSGWGPEMLLNIIGCRALTPQGRMAQPEPSLVVVGAGEPCSGAVAVSL